MECRRGRCADDFHCGDEWKQACCGRPGLVAIFLPRTSAPPGTALGTARVLGDALSVGEEMVGCWCAGRRRMPSKSERLVTTALLKLRRSFCRRSPEISSCASVVFGEGALGCRDGVAPVPRQQLDDSLRRLL